ncbi:MAG TPA: hypothetical protein VEB59_04720, partial [Gemmatimonadales bacterium]|nr:hypothetical protein [Gemmatimonadales bacterium]
VWSLRTGLNTGMRVGSAISGSWVPRWIPRAGAAAGFTVGMAIALVPFWYLDGLEAAGIIGTLGVAAAGVAVSRWFGPTLTTVRFALLAILLLIFFRWVGL